MKPIQSLIQKAHDKGLLRYAPPNLVWDDRPAQRQRQFELDRTGMSGVEFGYILSLDEITWATQSIDGVELDPADFLEELREKVIGPEPVNELENEVYAIYSKDDPTLWWTNELGWTSHVPSRDIFTKEERESLNLPLEGEWSVVDPDAGEFDEEFPDEHSHKPQDIDPGVTGLHACDSEGRHYYLQIHLNDEGLVFDVYDRYGDEHLATWARTYDELVDFVFASDVLAKREEQPCQHYAQNSAVEVDDRHELEIDETELADVDGVKCALETIAIDGFGDNVDNDQIVEDAARRYVSIIEDVARQHYAKTRAIVDEEPEVTEHNDERPLQRFLVTEVTAISARSEMEALDNVVGNIKAGDQEVVSQHVEPQLERYRVGRESYFWAENREHAIEQYLDMMESDNGYPNVAEIVSYE